MTTSVEGEGLTLDDSYRLNIFGFPTAAGLSEQNFGLMDQRFAVEWIQENIGKFGGDVRTTPSQAPQIYSGATLTKVS